MSATRLIDLDYSPVIGGTLLVPKVQKIREAPKGLKELEKHLWMLKELHPHLEPFELSGLNRAQKYALLEKINDQLAIRPLRVQKAL